MWQVTYAGQSVSDQFDRAHEAEAFAYDWATENRGAELDDLKVEPREVERRG